MAQGEQKPTLEEKLKSPEARLFLERRKEIIENNEKSPTEKVRILQELNNAYLPIAELSGDTFFIEYVKAAQKADSAGSWIESSKTSEKKKRFSLKNLIKSFKPEHKEHELSPKPSPEELKTKTRGKHTPREVKESKAEGPSYETTDPLIGMALKTLSRFGNYTPDIINKLFIAGTLRRDNLENSLKTFVKKTHNKGYQILIIGTEEKRRISKETDIPETQVFAYLKQTPDKYLLSFGKGRGKIVHYSKGGIEAIIEALNKRSRRKKKEEVKKDDVAEGIIKERLEEEPKSIYLQDNGVMCLKCEDAYNMLIKMSPLYTREIFERLLRGYLQTTGNGNILKESMNALVSKTRNFSPFLLTQEVLENNIYKAYVQGEKRKIISPQTFNSEVFSKLHSQGGIFILSEKDTIVHYLSKKITNNPIFYLQSRVLLEADKLEKLTKTQVIICFNVLLWPKLKGRIIYEPQFNLISNNIYVVRELFQGNTRGPYNRTTVKTVLEHVLGSSIADEIATNYSVIQRSRGPRRNYY